MDSLQDMGGRRFDKENVVGRGGARDEDSESISQWANNGQAFMFGPELFRKAFVLLHCVTIGGALTIHPGDILQLLEPLNLASTPVVLIMQRAVGRERVFHTIVFYFHLPISSALVVVRVAARAAGSGGRARTPVLVAGCGWHFYHRLYR